MSYEKVQEFFNGVGLGDRVTVHETPCDTVEHAANNIGCEQAQIAKTMSFLLDEAPIVVVCTGDSRVQNAKYKEVFGKKAKMVPWDSVNEIIGHVPGGVCPFALNDGVKVYLDVSLKRFEVVHVAAGACDATVSLTVDELEKCTGFPEWVEVC